MLGCGLTWKNLPVDRNWMCHGMRMHKYISNVFHHCIACIVPKHAQSIDRSGGWWFVEPMRHATYGNRRIVSTQWLIKRDLPGVFLHCLHGDQAVVACLCNACSTYFLRVKFNVFWYCIRTVVILCCIQICIKYSPVGINNSWASIWMRTTFRADLPIASRWSLEPLSKSRRKKKLWNKKRRKKTNQYNRI